MPKRFSASRMLGAAFAVLFIACAGNAGAVEAPKRVVSLNVCTDQLAMLMAGEGQLLSVSHLATDPNSSVLAEQAKDYVINHGLAEEIFLMHPDLVLAGTYTTRTTVGLLRRLGVRVEEFTSESSIEDIRANVARMGEILGRQHRSQELIAEIDQGLADLAANPPPRLAVALYEPNGYTSGAGTLSDAIVRASGLENVADRLGLVGTVHLPLELLVLAAPDLLLGNGDRHGAPALAEQIFAHPAYRALLGPARSVAVPGAYMICGAPFTLEVARRLQAAARSQGEAE
ncbi:MAG TPA: ABC transporter substrate-binding protein [Rhizobiaceae bacterium]|nr:ABC transporter substrate-binding protein [Rhizobiaceae bacterium]